MKKTGIISLLALLIVAFTTQSCSDTESYADQKKKEKDAIASFIKGNDIVPNIEVISEEQFSAQNSTTKSMEKGDNVNQFVLFSATGIYLQIINKGEGSMITSGQSKNVLCRYVEYDILDKDTLSANVYYASICDKMIVKNASGTFSGTFTEGTMSSKYNSNYVPEAWLVPFTYINVGRATDNLAKVRVIAPHTSGTSSASTGVYPTYYEISYELGR